MFQDFFLLVRLIPGGGILVKLLSKCVWLWQRFLGLQSSLCSEAIVAMSYAAGAGCWNLVLMYLDNRAQYTYVKQLSGIRPFGPAHARMEHAAASSPQICQ